MNDTKEIFGRASLQQLRSFFLNGVENCKISEKSLEERMEDAQCALDEALKEIISDDKVLEKAVLAAIAYACDLNDIYMEVGMQSGFTLAAKLCKE